MRDGFSEEAELTVAEFAMRRDEADVTERYVNCEKGCEHKSAEDFGVRLDAEQLRRTVEKKHDSK